MTQHFHRSSLALGALLSLNLATAATAQTPVSGTTASAAPSISATSTNPTRTQARFLTAAIEGNLAEIAMGQLALQKASDAEVRTFAQTMIDDHTAANDRAVKLAENLRIGAPAQPGLLQRAKSKTLSALNGPAFDRAYVKLMVSDHKSDVALYQREAGLTGDGSVMTYAKDTLPTLQQHLDRARKLDNRLNGQQ